MSEMDSTRYLIIDTAMPERRNKVWSPTIEAATRFSSQKQAEAWKGVTVGATGVLERNDIWYVVKESK